MNTLFVSLIPILAGGLFAPLLYRRYRVMKSVAASLIALGCIFSLLPVSDGLLNASRSEFAFSVVRVFVPAFNLDGIAAFFLILILGVSCLAIVYSYHYLNKPAEALVTAINYFFFSLLIVAMVLVVCADNMITFAVAWEMMSLSSFFLVMYKYQEERTNTAGYLYFIFTQTGALAIFSAFGIVYAYSGDVSFNGFAMIPSQVKTVVFILLLIGFGSKAGAVPFHIWLPYAHPAAPSHISAVMSGVMIKVGLYGIIRFYLLLDSHWIVFGEIVLVCGIVTALSGVINALGQKELKRFLAYSTIDNVGIILIGLGIGMIGIALNATTMAVLGFTGVFFHIFSHAVFKSLLFMGAGLIQQKTGVTSIELLGGLFKRTKVTGVTFLIGSLAIAGLPPLNGFVSELLIYLAAFNGIVFERTSFILAAIAILALAITGGLALVCFTKVFGIIFLGEARSDVVQKTDEKGLAMLFPMVALSLICVLTGVFPQILLEITLRILPLIPGLQLESQVGGLLAISWGITKISLLFGGIVLLLLLVRLFLYRRKALDSSSTWGCGYTRESARIQYTGTSYSLPVLKFFSPFTLPKVMHIKINSHFPKKRSHYSIIFNDIAEMFWDRGLVKPIRTVFDKLRWIQHGEIHLYIGYILVTIIILMLLI
jgi:hydrogenase-4 component B